MSLSSIAAFAWLALVVTVPIAYLVSGRHRSGRPELYFYFFALHALAAFGMAGLDLLEGGAGTLADVSNASERGVSFVVPVVLGLVFVVLARDSYQQIARARGERTPPPDPV